MGFTHNLLIEDCSNIILGPNNFDRNPRYNYGDSLDARNGLVVRNCEDCTLTGLHVTNVWREPAALLIEGCKRMNVTNCTILDCDNVGLLLKDVTNSRVSDCRSATIVEGKPVLVVTGGGQHDRPQPARHRPAERARGRQRIRTIERVRAQRHLSAPGLAPWVASFVPDLTPAPFRHKRASRRGMQRTGAATLVHVRIRAAYASVTWHPAFVVTPSGVIF
jgi:hypothetical protein